MGLLGLDLMQLFSDRIFNSIDIDGDGRLCFEDYV